MRSAGHAARSTKGSSSCCWDRRVPASRRCSTSSAASTCRPAARCCYRDIDLTRADEAALTAYRRRHVGFVFQFYNLIPSLTARRTSRSSPRSSDAPMPPRGRARAGQARRTARSLSGAAVRRRAAARRHRPRHRQAAVGAAVRRADRRARHLHRHRRARGAGAGQRRARHDDRRHHAQRRDRVDGRSGDPPGRRPGRQRRGPRPTSCAAGS